MDSNAETPPSRWVTAHNAAPSLRTEALARTHRIASDEPLAAGGGDTAPDPHELLLSAVATCMAITARMYAKRKGYAVDAIDVRVRRHRPAGAARSANAIEREVTVTGNITDAERARVIEIADQCPISRLLASGVSFMDATDLA